METQTVVAFPPFQLDLRSEQLWREDDVIALRPKTFAVLRYLVEHPGKLVTKDELLDAVWAGTVVSDTVLKSCIRELREALSDDAQTPRFIATVHRRGYRFIGPLSTLPTQSTVPMETGHGQREEEERKVARKLAAILSADVQGYSRLMGQDEVGTIRTLTTYRTVMAALIEQHHGRVVDAPGDNMLAEFGSAVEAMQCAVAIQHTLRAKNAELPVERQMAFRIGLNVGDVIVEGERLYGDGVNIAARLEGLAEGGGLCISGTVYDQVKTKVALVYEYRGEQAVKNIAEPVRAYRVKWEPEGHTTPAPATSVQQDLSQLRPIAHLPSPGCSKSPQGSTPVVGREAELSQLDGYWKQALSGARQVVFVTGEAGIGKTTRVDTFLHTLALSPQHPTPFFWLGRGQCIEQYGAGEAYMPILEALGRLCREPKGERLIALLNQHAPTWLVQLSTLLMASELEALQRKVQGATRERMLREMAEALDAITAERPLILWLEDLHWSDVSTLELLALLARRREPARVLILGTYRPVDVIVTEHPLRTMKQELQLHGQCQELAVRLLTEEAIGEYLAVRVPGGTHSRASLQRLAYEIYQRTEGNPLFIVNVVDELLAQGKLDNTAIEISAPATIREMIVQQLERLSAEVQRVLEVASVAGMEFSAAAVAAGEATIGSVEACCATLARRGQFLRANGTAEWPDKTVATRYGFLHALYQEVTYERVPEGRRVSLHQRIGERMEAAYGKQASEIAAELAAHFERGRDYHKAVQYLQLAGQNATQRSAYQEVIGLLTQGLELLKALPDTPEHTQQELALYLALTLPLMNTRGYGNPAVEQTLMRMRELCQQIREPPQLCLAQMFLAGFYAVRTEWQTARELGEHCLRLAQELQDPTLLLGTHLLLGIILLSVGEPVSARTHLEQGIALYDPQQHHFLAFLWGFDPGEHCLSFAAHVLWMLGYPDQALARSREAITLARDLSHPFSLAWALGHAAQLHQYRWEVHSTQEQAEVVITLATEEGFPQNLAWGTIMRGWALAEQGHEVEGIVQLRKGIAAYRADGASEGQGQYLALLADAQGKLGCAEEGLNTLAEALAAVDKTGERFYEAELHRLKGELTLQQWKVERQKVKGKRQKAKITDPRSPTPDPQGEAEACFLKAIDIARRQQAKSWELRTTMSLARLWQRQGKQKEAHKLLAEIYGWFTEGFDTKDLQEAKALLEELE